MARCVHSRKRGVFIRGRLLMRFCGVEEVASFAVPIKKARTSLRQGRFDHRVYYMRLYGFDVYVVPTVCVYLPTATSLRYIGLVVTH